MPGPSAHIVRSDSEIRELAALFAKGFLRVTRKGPALAVSTRRDPRNSLDLPRKPRPHVQANRRA